MVRHLAIGAVAGASATTLILPVPVQAHALVGRVDTPLPLAVYLAGAAIVVAMSFVVVMVGGVSWNETPAGAPRRVPRLIPMACRVIGIVGWAWIMAQLVFGGSSDAEVSTLFAWVYGWVGIAAVSALVGPVWPWLDPFVTVHDAASWIRRRLGFQSRTPATYPWRLAHWPAVAAFVFVVWLELAVRGGSMGVVVLGYTIITLLGMRRYGRDPWRVHAELFSVWFGILGRAALFAPAGPPGSRLVRRQYFPDGLVTARWDASAVVMATLGAVSIIYDGLSQSQPVVDLIGVPDTPTSTVLLAGALITTAGVALGVARRSGLPSVGAGLVPIAAGYLVAHYLTYFLRDAQRLVIAVSDPFQLGWDLFGTAFFVPGVDHVSPALLWLVMVTAVVGGHVMGAWAGHFAAIRAAPRRADVRRAQVPMALVMVGLTTCTLWSLGQNVVQHQESPRDATSARGAAVRPVVSGPTLPISRGPEVDR